MILDLYLILRIRIISLLEAQMNTNLYLFVMKNLEF